MASLQYKIAIVSETMISYVTSIDDTSGLSFSRNVSDGISFSSMKEAETYIHENDSSYLTIVQVYV